MKPFAKLLSILFIGVLLVGPSVPHAYADGTGNPVVSSVEDTSSSTPPTESSSAETPIPNDGSSATSTEDVVEKGEATSTNETVEEDAVTNSFSARSASLMTADSATIDLEIETASSTLYDGPLTVTACPDARNSVNETINGFCAIEQSGLPVTWTWFTFGGESAFLNTIEGIGNGNGSDTYWTWFSGTDAGMTGLNQHVLTANEHLVVAIDRMPLRISVATSTPVVGSSTTITVEGFNAFNFDYEPVAGAVIVGASAPNTDERGVTGFTATSTDTLTISATAPGFLTSNALTITPTAESVSTTTSGGGASGGSGNSGDSNFNTSAAFTYLVSRQHSNGSFGADGYSDWAAFAFMLPDAPSGARAALITYQKTASPSLTVVNDYERHALALEALGINPSTGTSRNYIAPIVAAFDGTQIGRASDVNDDMFGLLALLYAGYSTNDPMIQKIVSFIVRQQHGDGSWLGGVDIAAAGIQSLEPVSSLPGVTGAIAKARTYLKNQQQSDGGFGNPDATSWTLQAVSALRETPTSWTIGTSTPLTYLTTMQQVDGSINSGQEDASAALWSTEYALPGAEGRTWASLLNSFTLPTGTTDSGSTAGSTTTPTLATTTIPVPTSSTTPAIVPSDIISSTTVSTDPLSTDLRKDAASKGYVLGTTTSVENSDQVHSETGAATTMPTPLSASFAHAVEHFFATVFLGLKEFFMHLFGKYGP